MESTYQLVTALGCTTGLIALFGLLRQVFRSPSTPAWIATTLVSYVLAIALTMGFAGSLFYLGFALNLFTPAAVAFAATFAIHLGLIALCLKVLPANAPETPQNELSANTAAA